MIFARTQGVIMLDSLITTISSGAIDSTTPHTAIAAVLCAALFGLFS